MHDLERFITAQDGNYDVALRELKQGRKQSHWIWYIFPQLKGLGHSSRSNFYGIANIEEARAYAEDPVLGPRYISCVEALLQHKETPIENIMGAIDAQKLRSSLTLMRLAGGGPGVQKALEIFFDGKPCPQTLHKLQK